MIRTRNRSSASAHPRLTAVVVFPTPPFWFAIATIFIEILRRHHLGPKLEGATTILFLPEQMIGIGQHLDYLEFAGLGEPAVENLQEEVTLEVDEDRLRVLVASFSAAATKRLFAWPNVNVAGPAFRGA